VFTVVVVLPVGKRTHNTVIMSTVIMGKNQRYKPFRGTFGAGIFEILISQSDEGKA
jgi:hypothetical protein